MCLWLKKNANCFLQRQTSTSAHFVLSAAHKVHSDSIVNNTQAQDAQKWISNCGRPKKQCQPDKGGRCQTWFAHIDFLFSIINCNWDEADTATGFRVDVVGRGLAPWRTVCKPCVRATATAIETFPIGAVRTSKDPQGGALMKTKRAKRIYSTCPQVWLSATLMLRDSATFQCRSVRVADKCQRLSASEWKAFTIQIYSAFYGNPLPLSRTKCRLLIPGVIFILTLILFWINKLNTSAIKAIKSVQHGKILLHDNFLFTMMDYKD